MSSSLPLEGKHVALIGRLKMGREAAKSALMELGATVSFSVPQKANLCVCGSTPGGRLQEAERNNLPILSQDDFLQLLEGASLDSLLNAQPAEEVENIELGDSLAGYREALALGPTRDAWNQIVGLLDACPDDQLEMTVEYLQQHMQDWETVPHENWWISSHMKANELEEGWPHIWKSRPDDWYVNSIESLGADIRIAPYGWMKDILAGVDSPKWSLIRHIHMPYMKLNGKLGAKLLEPSHLNHVTCLDVAENDKLPAKFFKQLRQTQGYRHLKSLRLGYHKDKAMAALQGESVFQLERLGIRDNGGFSQDAIDSILSAECTQTVHTIDMMAVLVPQKFVQAIQNNPDSLPDLASLRQHLLYPEAAVTGLIASGVLERLRHVEIAFSSWKTQPLMEFLQASHFPNLRTLDLCHMKMLAFGERTLEEVSEWLKEALQQSGLLEQLETVVLGELKTPALEELLSSHNTQIQ